MVASVASETNFSITLANMSSGVGRKGVEMAEPMIGSRMPASNARRFLLGRPPPQKKKKTLLRKKKRFKGLKELQNSFLPAPSLASCNCGNVL